jgi:hypothetical protein
MASTSSGRIFHCRRRGAIDVIGHPVTFALCSDGHLERPLRLARLKTHFGYGMPDAFRDLLGVVPGSSWQKDSEFITSDASD